MALLWSRGAPATDWAGLHIPPPPRSTGLSRLWRGFMTARVFVGIVLLLLQGVTYGLGQPFQPVAMAISTTYFALALLGARVLYPQPPIRALGLAWIGSIGVDLAAFALLQLLQSGSINFTPLFALPVLMGAVVGTLPVGLATTAAVTLLLLGDALHYSLGSGPDAPARYLQAALTGTGLFVVALLAHQLALRLAREEVLASRSRTSAQMHAQVNELVIETLGEGVLVVDVDGRVHAVNPAADMILGHGLAGMTLPFALDSYPAWRPLAQLAAQTFKRRNGKSAELPIAQSRGAAREVRIRTRLTPAMDQRSEGFCVMFLQDLRELEARIRTEKLAAMGRMSAAVAHEIRNPLAAIAQASALLAEDLADEGQRQLNEMVRQNAQRLARIVDDVLDVSRARQQRTLPLDDDTLALDPAVRTLVEEWVRQTRRPGVQLLLGAGAQVRFEEEHLRRILVNLLDNAARYASQDEGAIQVSTTVGANQRAQLVVWSDGDPLDPAVQRHLFEPFFSSESRSSGLGLYICRELCERHGAAMGYERRAVAGEGREGNSFFVHFAPAQVPLPQ
ncbi:Sensor protein ZraS [Xylophilus ampelinus]|nr:PAS domain-containing sensor histidine kinase [Variovorax sp.]VTY34798.1 Sensor protein ZraS [Xylophilus ampelinus]